MTPWILVLIVFVGNLPFGYWRESVERFSAPWFVAVHAMVPVILAARLGLDLPFDWAMLPPMVLAYLAGQALGARWRRRQCAPATVRSRD
jgi:hypothetical protein